MDLPCLLSMNSLVGISFCFIYLFSYALFRLSTSFSSLRKRLPPEAGGGLLLIGHLHLLRRKEPAHITLANMADAYGPIFTLRLGMCRALVVSSWEIARECLTTNDVIFATRPKLSVSKLLGYDYAMFGFSPYGPYWRQVCKIVNLHGLSNQRLEQQQHIRKSEVQSSIRKLYDFWAKTENDEGHSGVVDMKIWFGDVTLNVIFRMVAGKSFSTAFEGDGNENYRMAMESFIDLSGVFVVSDSLPFLHWLDLGGHVKAMKKTAKELDEVFDKWLKEHRQRRNSSEVKCELDFMDVMLSIVENGEEFSSYDVDTVIKSTCLGMILGTSDTTKVTLTWALALLLNDKEAVKKAQLELEKQVGRERQVKESDIKNLPYLQAIMKEALRLYPAAPLSLPHESMEDCTVAGYHIPAGTRLLINLKKLQRDPVVWERPSEFVPERFLMSQKDFDVRGQSPAFMPFGSGRRVCPGISFALQIMQLTLANLLHGFEIGTPSGGAVDMEESGGLTGVKTTPLDVVLTPRLPAHVYA